MATSKRRRWYIRYNNEAKILPKNKGKKFLKDCSVNSELRQKLLRVGGRYNSGADYIEVKEVTDKWVLWVDGVIKTYDVSNPYRQRQSGK